MFRHKNTLFFFKKLRIYRIQKKTIKNVEAAKAGNDMIALGFKIQEVLKDWNHTAVRIVPTRNIIMFAWFCIIVIALYHCNSIKIIYSHTNQILICKCVFRRNLLFEEKPHKSASRLSDSLDLSNRQDLDDNIQLSRTKELLNLLYSLVYKLVSLLIFQPSVVS